MTTTNTEPTVEEAELEVTAAAENLTSVRESVAAGTIEDPSELDAAETRHRFALFRRTGARERAAKAAHTARKAALATLADKARTANPTATVNAAYDEFEAAVEAAVAVFATKVRKAHADTVEVTNEAHALDVPTARDEAEEGMYRFGSQLHFPIREGGPDTYIETPYPVTHGNTTSRLERTAKNAIATGIQKERS